MKLATIPPLPLLGLSLPALAAITAACCAAYANAPPGHYAVKAQGVVRDEKTGLLWEQKASVATFTHDQALAHCSELGLDGGGWRLPSIRELNSLVDTSRVNPAIDAIAFPGTEAAIFRTSTPHASIAGTTWTVDFHYGQAQQVLLQDPAMTRCVR